MSEYWGPRAHPERCHEWKDQDAKKRRLDQQVEWGVLIFFAAILAIATWWRN